MTPVQRFGYDCDGLLAAVRSEATPGWPQTGHWDERAPWMAKYCANRARVLGLLKDDTEPVLVRVSGWTPAEVR